MSTEEILQRLIDDVRVLVDFDTDGYHSVCGPCDKCLLAKEVLSDIEAAELEMERARLGITEAA